MGAKGRQFRFGKSVVSAALNQVSPIKNQELNTE